VSASWSWVVTYETWSTRMGKSCPMKGGGGYHSLLLASVGRLILSVGVGRLWGWGQLGGDVGGR
jgi:hypothetical protein